MATRVTSWLWRPGLLRMLLSQVRLASRLLREPRVPLLAKTVPLLAAVYLISPIDFVPDFIPVVGQTDDLSLALAALALFVRICPTSTVDFHRDAIADGARYTPMSSVDDVIEAEWRRET
jgi:uncharacterized membrane protein YkvA (DUF1232 family)